ncbi:SDR family NAD(P)-dependent oxidoreductase [Phenylobacterium koreense]|uniref:NAD(P)-dependent dehydrogenase (Short-subunit alcohol dehydrogenase family) n=1 Tax=Phenylobacterium koreense TaxID=266125 RepID=A0ABV2EM50_9CAUL
MEQGRKSFTVEDQVHFARLSGDVNPMHMDANFARRTQMGAPVVHGVHGVLWALEEICRRESPDLNALKVNFSGPVYVGDAATAVLGKRSGSQLRVQVQVDGATATTITLGLGEPARGSVPVVSAPEGPNWPKEPIPLKLEEMRGRSGAIEFATSESEIAEAFPALSSCISPRRVAAVAALSRVVGMICPGMHSIFSGFSLAFTGDAAGNRLEYATTEIDERFRMVRLTVAGGGIEGELTALARIPPVAQPTIYEVAAAVAPTAYAGDAVLVVGGSRGLGEVTAKACAAGGARVFITYATGHTEANKVVEEIRAFGGECEALPLDVRGDVAAQLSRLPVAPSHLYYYATGPIAQRRTKLLSQEVLAEFMRFYATGFVETVEALRAMRADAQLNVFYPSSVAVNDTPKGWLEYAMAKAAGEIVCREIGTNLPNVRVLCARLPRILTDQTANVRATEAAPIIEVIMPIVRDLHEASR